MMKPPFVLVELLPGDIDVFENVEALLGAVEPIDVLNGEYAVFDCEGQVLNLKATSRRYNIPMSLEPFKPPKYDVTQLREHLIQWLSHGGEGNILRNEVSLDELINKCLELQIPGCIEQIWSILRPRRIPT